MSNVNRDKFLAYLHKPISKENVQTLYNTNNIKYEKCELYSDFVQSLLRMVFDTYMGDDVTSFDEQIKHFNWCWDRNVRNFIKEGLTFEDTRLYEYFLEFMVEVFYTSVDKNMILSIDKSILKLWLDVFDYEREKTNADIDTLIEIYEIMEKSIKTSQK